jgi:serine/threonine-protein kinase
LIEVIGKGGAAVVYMARQLSIDRLVAIKVLSPRPESDEEDFRARFVREARLIARLEHDRIVPTYDFGEEDGHYYLVMRLMENGLNRLLHNGPLSVEMTDIYVQQICRALQFAHDKNIVHRDIKPSNILLSRDDGAYLSDFGLAKLLGGTTNITEQGSILGTPTYMAPEMWQDEAATVATDIYALGVTIFEMLHGAPPYSANLTV